MKSILNVVKWTAIIAGIVAIPILVRKKMDDSVRKSENVRYDINDYISETGL